MYYLVNVFNVRVHVVNVTNARFFVRSVLCSLTSQYLMTEYAWIALWGETFVWDLVTLSGTYIHVHTDKPRVWLTTYMLRYRSAYGRWSLWELDDRGSLIRRGPDTVRLHVYTFSREFIAWISKSLCSSMLSVKVLHILQILSTCRYMKWVERSDSVSSHHFQGVNPPSPKNDQHKISPYNISAL